MINLPERDGRGNLSASEPFVRPHLVSRVLLWSPMSKRTEVKQEPVHRRSKSSEEESQEERLRGIDLSDLAESEMKCKWHFQRY